MPTVNLTWTQADTIGPRVESYKVYRRAGAAADSLLTSLPVDFGAHPGDPEIHPLAYSDTTAGDDTSYTYRVDAFTDDGRSLASNSFAVVTPAVPEGVVILAGERSTFGGSLIGFDAGVTLSSGTQEIGELTSNSTALDVVKVTNEPNFILDPVFVITALGVLAQGAFSSITFVSDDQGTITFNTADVATFADDASGPQGPYSEWGWVASATPYFTAGSTYTVLIA